MSREVRGPRTLLSAALYPRSSETPRNRGAKPRAFVAVYPPPRNNNSSNSNNSNNSNDSMAQNPPPPPPNPYHNYYPAPQQQQTPPQQQQQQPPSSQSIPHGYGHPHHAQQQPPPPPPGYYPVQAPTRPPPQHHTPPAPGVPGIPVQQQQPKIVAPFGYTPQPAQPAGGYNLGAPVTGVAQYGSLSQPSPPPQPYYPYQQGGYAYGRPPAGGFYPPHPAQLHPGYQAYQQPNPATRPPAYNPAAYVPRPPVQQGQPQQQPQLPSHVPLQPFVQQPTQPPYAGGVQPPQKPHHSAGFAAGSIPPPCSSGVGAGIPPGAGGIQPPHPSPPGRISPPALYAYATPPTTQAPTQAPGAPAPVQFVNPPTPPVIHLKNHGVDDLPELKEFKPARDTKEKFPIPEPGGVNNQAPVPAKLLYDDSLAAFAPGPGPKRQQKFDLLETACIEAPLSNLRARAAVRAEYSALKERHRRRKNINTSVNIVSDVVKVESGFVDIESSSSEEDDIVEVWNGGLD